METNEVCIILSLIAVATVTLAWLRKLPETKPIKGRTKLVVTAHPDDECMFFGPFIAQEVSQGNQVHLVCLSDGDYEGKGLIRRREIKGSCKELGIPEKFCCVVENRVLMDDPGHRWETVGTIDTIERYCDQHAIGAVVSFDSYGVSGHENHRALFDALLELSKTSKFTSEIFILESVPLLRKYCLTLDLWCFLLQKSEYVYSLDSTLRDKPRRAMMHHVTQLTWYRHLYLRFSRYMVVNTFKDIRSLPEVKPKIEKLDFTTKNLK